MTTNIEVNKELVKEAFRLTNCKTEKELITQMEPLHLIH